MPPKRNPIFKKPRIICSKEVPQQAIANTEQVPQQTPSTIPIHDPTFAHFWKANVPKFENNNNGITAQVPGSENAWLKIFRDGDGMFRVKSFDGPILFNTGHTSPQSAATAHATCSINKPLPLLGEAIQRKFLELEKRIDHMESNITKSIASLESALGKRKRDE